MTCIFFWHQINEKIREETRMTQRCKEKRRIKETKFSGGCGGQCPPRQAQPISRSARRKLSAFTTGWSWILLLHIICQNVEVDGNMSKSAKKLDKIHIGNMWTLCGKKKHGATSETNPLGSCENLAATLFKAFGYFFLPVCQDSHDACAPVSDFPKTLVRS